MRDMVVRLEGVTIENFKNVEFGELSFINKRKAYRTSVLGLYGQNGSGKTALIDAMELLKLALSGRPVPMSIVNYINVGAEYATIAYEFKVSDEQESYRAWYSYELRSEIELSASLSRIRTFQEWRAIWNLWDLSEMLCIL